MKKILLLLTMMWLPIRSSAQASSNLVLEPYFSAIIVNDLDSSIAWYSRVLGFDVLNKVESEQRGFRQANLRKGTILIEMIELANALSSREVVPGYNDKTRMTGFFKTGFLVPDFVEWIDHLTRQKVEFYGNVVTDRDSGKKMVIITDPDGNRIQIFEK